MDLKEDPFNLWFMWFIGTLGREQHSSFNKSEIYHKKSRIRETKNLWTDADSMTDTILESLRDLSKN